MSDELDPQLLRCFAHSQAPLADAQFTARVSAHLGARAAPLRVRAAGTILASIIGGVVTGISAPLRLRHAGLTLLAAAAVTLWTALQSLWG